MDGEEQQVRVDLVLIPGLRREARILSDRGDGAESEMADVTAQSSRVKKMAWKSRKRKEGGISVSVEMEPTQRHAFRGR